MDFFGSVFSVSVKAVNLVEVGLATHFMKICRVKRESIWRNYLTPFFTVSVVEDLETITILKIVLVIDCYLPSVVLD